MPKDPQFAFGNRELREAALQADLELWEHPHNGLVQTFESGKMNSDFPIKEALVVGLTRFAGHKLLPNQKGTLGSCCLKRINEWK